MNAKYLIKGWFVHWMIFAALLTVNTGALGSVPPREWVRTYNRDATQTNIALKVEIGADNRAVVAGSSQNSTNNLDYLVLKYQSDGTVGWQYRHDTLGHDEMRAMTVDSETNVVVTGTSKTVKVNAAGSRMWEAPFAGRDVAVASGFVHVGGFSDVEASVAKLSKDGTVQWSRTTNQPNKTVTTRKVTTDALGNVYAATMLTECFRGLCFDKSVVLKYLPNGKCGPLGS
jgi:hypothetical protein